MVVVSITRCSQGSPVEETRVTPPYPPAPASLTSSCKQVIHHDHFLSCFHGIALDFEFSLQGGKSIFTAALPCRGTPPNLQTLRAQAQPADPFPHWASPCRTPGRRRWTRWGRGVSLSFGSARSQLPVSEPGGGR